MIDTELYGGRLAYLRHLTARALSLAGAYRTLTDIDWSAIERLVFICKGNICRSPYGAARARLLGFDAASFGLEAVDGALADPNAARNAQHRKLDLSAHRSLRLDAARLRNNDLLLVFEPRQLHAVEARCGRGPTITLAGLWVNPVRPYVSDPYGRSDRYFQECFGVIDASVTALVSRINAARNDNRHPAML
jgi:protein-tyrosine phosphatase